MVNLVGVAMQRWKAHHACFPLCSSAGIRRKVLSQTKSPLGELEVWARAVFNEGLDDDAEDLVVGRVTNPDVVVHPAEERETAIITAEEEEDKRDNQILDSIPY